MDVASLEHWVRHVTVAALILISALFKTSADWCQPPTGELAIRKQSNFYENLPPLFSGGPVVSSACPCSQELHFLCCHSE
tara:strand:+ start:74 stop:313 length:240 start_codon:yes stop_codon:yes gene_type:complete